MKTELEILDAFKRKKKWAGKELYSSHVMSMRAACSRYLNHPADVEDVLQEGFIKVLLNINKFQYREEGSLKRWIKTIMINTCITFLKKKNKHCLGDKMDDVKQEENNPLNMTDTEVEDMSAYELVNYADFSRDEMLDALHAVPPPFRAVFNLCVIEEYKHHEAAKLLGLQENTCRTRLARARKILQKELYRKGLKKVSNK